jgi:hypothetical protein
MIIIEIIILLEDIRTEKKKREIVNYLNNHNITSQEIYNWLINNQDDSFCLFTWSI